MLAVAEYNSEMRIRRQPSRLIVFVLASLLIAGVREAAAHAALRTASPAAGAQLDEAPPEIRLTFTESIEPSLSLVVVRNTAGKTITPRCEATEGNRRTCVARLQPLDAGTYSVEWRVVSADGHTVTGRYSFAIRPAAQAAPEPTSPPPAVAMPPTPPPPMRASRREMAARWLFIMGVAALVGASAASVIGFGGNSDTALAGGGWLIAVGGIALLADAQRRNAVATIGELLSTSIGRALIFRLVLVLLAGAALVIARSSRADASRHRWMTIVSICSLLAIAAHVAAGHAGAAERFTIAAIGVQWLHFSAAGVWLGGLAALLAGTRGQPDATKTAAVRGYSKLAGLAIGAVALTGVLRTVQEVPSWSALAATAYGQAALAKAALLVVLAALGAVNRWHSVPEASATLRPLRMFAFLELAVMLVVLGLAAILATLPPPR
jgi:copper transport protein